MLVYSPDGAPPRQDPMTAGYAPVGGGRLMPPEGRAASPSDRFATSCRDARDTGDDQPAFASPAGVTATPKARSRRKTMALAQPEAAPQRHSPIVAQAWRDYLAATRHLKADRYEQIEPWAWYQLQQRLQQP